jgi:hypothetical protein
MYPITPSCRLPRRAIAPRGVVGGPPRSCERSVGGCRPARATARRPGLAGVSSLSNIRSIQVGAVKTDSNLRKWTHEELVQLQGRVDLAGSVARGAHANLSGALSALIMAFIGAAVTLESVTDNLSMTPLRRALLVAITASGFSALLLLVALTIETVRAMRIGVTWQSIYERACRNEISYEDVLNQVKNVRVTLGILWKITLPGAALAFGLIAAVVIDFI